ncbi:MULTISPECIES: monofunctional biosynthetic peptidoglycan transglycosylase [unclassified Hyphomicrobium]|uniref:monofunctional biosynthetic peptidoglycan transglycosylase n=1 Tax=unclassified Hyphomicrobium TaxID=2619925 RepID=UPI000213F008|nr:MULTISPECIES: monofunctional biosynthetic peptidoglycan transglycosylase [unclassified Hyphomicrobium]CCB67294.1 Monofunctional biosynthetic peptidoglycan transglycosylase [Hyphomicrobium sp. MC1]
MSLQPPRPLPARAFRPEPSTSPAPALAMPAGSHAHAAAGTLSADAIFSEIDAEASSRSLSAIETAAAEALREIKPHKPLDIAELVLPSPTAAASTDLGHMIPQRMFEPHFQTPPQAASDGLRIDTAMRPEPLRADDAGIEPATAVDRPPQPSGSVWALLKRGLKLLAWIAIGWLALVLALIVAYRFVNPPASMLMLQHWLTGQPVVQEWVPFGQISPNIVRAVILSEDARFCQHPGVDLEAIEEAIENTDGRARGGSTISMQVVKNLFLWPSKSYVRKAIELPLTYLTEVIWSKRRIMEIYLNIAQWGPGIFGIGAAAEHHFDKPARSLSVRDAARLAVSLPNPLERNAGRPGPGLQRLANAIQVRMRLAPSGQFACVLPRRPY